MSLKLGLSSCVILTMFILRTVTSFDLSENTEFLRQIAAPLFVQTHTTNETMLFERLLNGYVSSKGRVPSFLEVLAKINTQINVSDDCQSDTNLVRNSSIFIKYIDAAAKIPFGILQGKWNWVGDYQECHDIESLYNPSTGKDFKGKYSTAVLLLNGKPIFGTSTVMFGVCFPNSCDRNDLKALLNELIFYIKIAAAQIYPDIAKENFAVYEVFPEESKSLDNGSTAVIVVSAVICVIVLFATVIDYGSTLFDKKDGIPLMQARYDDLYEDTNDTVRLLAGADIQANSFRNCSRKLLDICRVFSVTSNGKKLFGTETATGPLACLNGMRVLSMWWVILGHTYFFVTSVADNLSEAAKLVQRFTFQPILNGTYSVDSFFFLSGLLVVYLAFKQINEKGQLSWPYYFLHRYWRLSPLYAFVILYFTFILPYTITGPNGFYVEQPQFTADIDVCKKYWWTNLLYINNFYPHYGNLGTTCLGWGWYLANDMQFYLVLGPIVILALNLRGRRYFIGIAITVLLIVVGIIIRGVLVWYYGIYSLTGQPTKHIDSPWAKNNPLYDKPYARMSVYLVGMLTGYVLAKTHNRIRINRLIALAGWCVAIATALALIYGQYYYNHNPGTHMTLVQSGFYVALGRTAWAMCLSWVVIACVYGSGGPVKDILSWPVWAPLGRLTYAAYLVHPIVMVTYYYSMEQPLHVTDLNMVYLFISNLVVSYIIAFIVSMLVEAPMIQLEKLLLPKFRNLFHRLRPASER